VTGETFAPRLNSRGYWQTDYGVVRRLYLPQARTVTVEGVHSLGSDSGARELTNPDLLGAAWSAVEEIQASGRFDDSASIEILVQGTYQPERNWESYDPHAIHVIPLAVVYNRNWIFRLDSRQGWIDQRPYDVVIELRGRGLPRMVQGDIEEVPRLEIVGGPEGFDARTAKLCRLILTSPLGAQRSEEGALRALLEAVTRASDTFKIVLVEDVGYGTVRRIQLPRKESEGCRIRKKFLIHLVFARILGLPLERRAALLRHYFPDYKTDLSDTDLESHYTRQVRGKFSENFPELIGHRWEGTRRIHVEFSRNRKTFNLLPIGLPIIVKLRF
jgi:hypothetical protein